MNLRTIKNVRYLMKGNREGREEIFKKCQMNSKKLYTNMNKESRYEA